MQSRRNVVDKQRHIGLVELELGTAIYLPAIPRLGRSNYPASLLINRHIRIAFGHRNVGVIDASIGCGALGAKRGS